MCLKCYTALKTGSACSTPPRPRALYLLYERSVSRRRLSVSDFLSLARRRADNEKEKNRASFGFWFHSSSSAFRVEERKRSERSLRGLPPFNELREADPAVAVGVELVKRLVELAPREPVAERLGKAA
jgi:hypothetical protein